MAASSVTGVGRGSAVKKQKGSEHVSLGAAKIVGPRVVYAGKATTDASGDVTVVLPRLPGVAANYVTMVTETGVSAAGACAVSLTLSANATTLVLKGPVSTECNVVIVKAGLAI